MGMHLNWEVRSTSHCLYPYRSTASIIITYLWNSSLNRIINAPTMHYSYSGTDRRTSSKILRRQNNQVYSKTKQAPNIIILRTKDLSYSKKARYKNSGDTSILLQSHCQVLVWDCKTISCRITLSTYFHGSLLWFIHSIFTVYLGLGCPQ